MTRTAEYLVGGGRISSCVKQRQTEVLVALGGLTGKREYWRALARSVVVVGAATQCHLGALEVTLRRRDAVEQHACSAVYQRHAAQYNQGRSSKKEVGTSETRLRQRFLNNLGLHTRTHIHVRKIATADLWSCPAIQLLALECLQQVDINSAVLKLSYTAFQ